MMHSILVHCCCGPCSTYPMEWLRKHQFDVAGLWYNPNIHPFTEHQRRLQAMQDLAKAQGLPLIVAGDYDLVSYFRAVVGHEGNRCGDCFRLRLGRTATVAAEKGFSAFSTTLLISPYQDQNLLRRIGEEVAIEAGVEFFRRDFTEGFRESQQKARELELYRQKYCGCVYSEWERFGKVKVG